MTKSKKTLKTTNNENAIECSQEFLDLFGSVKDSGIEEPKDLELPPEDFNI